MRSWILIGLAATVAACGPVDATDDKDDTEVPVDTEDTESPPDSDSDSDSDSDDSDSDDSDSDSDSDDSDSDDSDSDDSDSDDSADSASGDSAPVDTAEDSADTSDTDTDVVIETDPPIETDSDTDTDTDAIDSAPDTFVPGGDTDTDGATGETDTDAVDSSPDTFVPGEETDTDTDAITVTDIDADGFTVLQGDCNDNDAGIYPGAPEYCSGIDEDCDGTTDGINAIDILTFYADSDGDSFGDPLVEQLSCSAPGAGWVENDADCDDSDLSILDSRDWYPDLDADGFGVEDGLVQQCEAPANHVAAAGDCDDANAVVYPANAELCDGFDNDCNGTTDVDAADAVRFYKDADGDGFGDITQFVDACAAPDATWVEDATDCDDTDAAVGVDRTWYADGDGDGIGDLASSLAQCEQPAGYVLAGGDCDDDNAVVFPLNPEVCDGFDNDCSGEADNDASDALTFYADTDGDTLGDAANTLLACVAPTGFVSDNTDCDDTDVSVLASRTWYADLDGDGLGDESSIEEVCLQPTNYVLAGGDCDDDDLAIGLASTWFADADADTFGDLTVTLDACDQPTGYVSNSDDCDDADTAITVALTWYADTDADTFGDLTATLDACEQPTGYVSNSNDCDDADTAITVAPTWYADADADTFGDLAVTLDACDQPTGYVADSTDCDDAAAGVNTAAAETCDGVDSNCSGDESDASDKATWYADADADTFGDLAVTLDACDQPTGYVADNTDCDDAAAGVNTAAAETCDGVDSNCSGDESDASDKATWYADADADTYGDLAVTLEACDQPTGYVADSTDCDDAAAGVNTAAAETCDGVDSNCSGDESDASDKATWYADADADTFGDLAVTLDACDQPTGYVADNTDCDDAAAGVNTAAAETCDGVDSNCSGDESDASDKATWYADADADTFGDLAVTLDACDQPTGYVADNTDCDDAAAGVNTAAAETCDGVDSNCSGDESDASDKATWYADADADTFGDLAVTLDACDQPTGYVADNTDCDDAAAGVNTAAAETCDGVDSNCSGDESDASDASTWYLDSDSDTLGDSSDSVAACNQPAGYVADDSDCEDRDANVGGPSTWYKDNDNDGLGTPNSTLVACTLPAGSVANSDDCDDNDAAVGAASTWYKDNDSDTYGDISTATTTCTPSGSFVADNTDCDDAAAGVNPGATETCDGTDNNCSGDESDASDASTWYADSDSDTYGDSSDSVAACSQPAGYVANDSDCDDSDGANGVAATWYADADADTYGDSSSSQAACDQPAGYVTDSTDCDDAAAGVYPGAAETCDGTDNNCSGDESDASDASTWYADSDSDTYGDSTTSQAACSQPAGYVADSSDCDDSDGAKGPATAWYADGDSDGYGDSSDVIAPQCAQPAGRVDQAGDCNDGNAAINEGATETCNGIDNDCDNDIDDGATCGTGVQVNEGTSSYIFFLANSDQVSWTDAEASCATFGYNLATVTSNTENTWVRNEVDTRAGDIRPYYIGFNDVANEGTFVWSSGFVDIGGYDNWGPGEPSDTNSSENYTEVTSDGTWNDSFGGSTLSYVCEAE